MRRYFFGHQVTNDPRVINRLRKIPDTVASPYHFRYSTSHQQPPAALPGEMEMFAVIETNGASQIVIHVPHEGADKTLPALARMLEQNATFVRTGYQEMTIVKPAMNITLGNSYKHQHSEEELAIAESGVVLGEDFVNASPEVFVSNALARKKAADEAQRLRTELSFTKDELARLRAQLEELTRSEEA